MFSTSFSGREGPDGVMRGQAYTPYLLTRLHMDRVAGEGLGSGRTPW
jgi:hypothetical protein